MPPDKKTIDATFLAVRELPSSERATYLDKACGGDAELRAEVEAMLRADARADRLRPPTNEELGSWLQRADALVGKRVGNCTLVRHLASGGMGVVYLAEQDEPKRTVAVKLMRSALFGDDMRTRFRHEVRALGSLTHPGIAQVFAAGTHESDALPYFVMEYVADARSLTEYVEEKRTDGDARVKLFLSVCEAVHFGHVKGVVHRDLKPDNILVGRDGQPKIIDFGIAKITDPDLAQTKALTRTGEIFGTLQYLSPEQLAGDPSGIDARSDVYSLGVVLYELLAGRLPYSLDGKDLLGVAQVIARRPPRFPAVGGDLDVVLGKALAKDPARRYASAAALRDDLARVLAGQPIEARPPSVGYQLRLFTKRHKAVVAAGIIAVVGLFSGAVVSLMMASRARDEARHAERETQRAQTAERTAVRETERAKTARETAVREAARARALWLESQRVTNTVAGELFDRIAYLPGSLGAREYLAEWLKGALDRLSKHVGDDPALRLVAARRFVRLGEIHGQHGLPNLGNTKEALEATERAITLLDSGGGIDLAIARARAADLVFRSGDLERAAKLEGQARDVLEAADKRDPLVLRNLVLLDVNSGLRLDKLSKGKEAIAASHRAVAYGRSLVAAAPDRAVHHLMLSRAQGLLGQRLIRQRDYAAAQKTLKEAVASIDAVADRLPPAALDGPRSLLQYYLGDLHFFQRRYAAAQVEYEKGVAHLRALVKREPRDRRARDNLGASLSRVGMTHSVQGLMLHKHPLHKDALGDDPKKKRALEHYRRAVAYAREELATYEELARRDPANIQRLYGLQDGVTGLATTLVKVQAWREAQELFARAEKLAKALQQREPASVDAVLKEFSVFQRRSHLFTFRSIFNSDARASLGFLQRSRADAQRAKTILETLDAAGQLPAHLKRLIRTMSAQIAETERNMGRIRTRIGGG